MKIYLLRFDDERWLFYSEEREAIDAEKEPRAPRRGLRGLIERKQKNLQAMLTESESGVGLHMRRLWEWLHERTHPDEALLRRLRNISAPTIHYPLTLTEEAARALWTHYLKNRFRRHLLWLIINATVVPVTLLLTPLPGPNLIGYWFVYRAVCHLLALYGLRRAGREQPATQFLSTSALDACVGIDEEQAAQLAAGFGLKHLDSFIKRATNKRNTLLAAS
ncbi:MAG: hypothetical protein ABR577_04905 [Pyrinomonadaceae bacterium]